MGVNHSHNTIKYIPYIINKPSIYLFIYIMIIYSFFSIFDFISEFYILKLKKKKKIFFSVIFYYISNQILCENF